MAPIVPRISSSPEALQRTVKAIADHGAAFVGMNARFLDGGTCDHVMNFLYARKYAPQAYVSEIPGFVASLQRRLGLQSRCRQEQAQETATPPQEVATQAVFEW